MSKTDINSHSGSGNIGKPIELRHTGQNMAVVDLSVAMTVGYGQRQHTVWTVITVWGKAAERLAQYAKKGDMVVWSGAVYNVEEWERNGEKRKKHFFEIGASGQINFYSRGERDDSGGGQESSRQETQSEEGW